MRLSIIIVNYNVKYFLEQALLSVRNASRGLSVEVFVVDNNSVDDSVHMVQTKFPEVKVIANKENVGFSKANNQAIRLSDGKYVLLLNPDTVLQEDTLQKCLDLMDTRADIGGLGVKMVDGSGAFLPESKRGFPSPFVAFCKTFGLSTLFPKSRVFNRYHLGYLDENESHEVDVLAGAFMLLRRSVLDEVGLLDEAFFMYGEDIDLSYRIAKAGHRNFYFADTAIIHYKGESTKKGSLNYVRVFYRAMIIFARKHFQGQGAGAFILALNSAIYFRAFLTLARNLLDRLFWVLTDATLLIGGMLLIKQFWAVYHFEDPHYYPESFNFVNVPLYVAIWLGGIQVSGAYYQPYHLRRLIRGVFIGALLIAAVYGFLDMAYRSSRAIIIFSLFWALIALPFSRMIGHFIRFRSFRTGNNRADKLVIVGSWEESKRVKDLLMEAGVEKNIVGTVAPAANLSATANFLGELTQLDEVVQIYKIEEIIFCSQDVTSEDIIQWMVHLGPQLDYKIVPKDSLSIIGSSSKETAGELYTIDIKFRIDNPLNRRNKRLLDLLTAVSLLLLFPFMLPAFRHPRQLIKNAFCLLTGKRTLVGYVPVRQQKPQLPQLRPGILTPLDDLAVAGVPPDAKRRLNIIYAKDYMLSRDLDILWKGLRHLDRKQHNGHGT